MKSAGTAPLPRRPGRGWRIAALAILVAGLLAAAALWVTAGDDASTAQGTSDRIVGGQIVSAAGDRQTERMGGQALVRTAAFDRWLGSLWQGRRLAVTIVVLAAVAAAACAWIGVLVDTPVDD